MWSFLNCSGNMLEAVMMSLFADQLGRSYGRAQVALGGIATSVRTYALLTVGLNELC